MKTNTASGIIDQLSQEDMEHEIRDAVQTAYEAEMNGEPMQNGKQRDVDASKNTHFEFPFDDGDREVYVYIERYSPENGIEVMLWPDREWFDESDGDFRTSLTDADEPLPEFGDEVLSLVADVIDADNTPSYEYLQGAGSSLVFSADFFL